MGPTSKKKSTALVDLQYIQSLLQKAKKKNLPSDAPVINKPETTSETTSNVTSPDSVLPGHKTPPYSAKSEPIITNANDEQSSSTCVITGSGTPEKSTPKRLSVDLVDDGAGTPPLDDHYNYNSHVRNTSPRDRMAILDALRKKKKMAQLDLHNVEDSKKCIKINLKSVTSNKQMNDDDLKQTDKNHVSAVDTTKSLQCTLPSVLENAKTSSVKIKTENVVIQHSNNNEKKVLPSNDSVEIGDANTRPTAASFFFPAAAEKEGQNNLSNPMVFNFSGNQRSEIGKIFGEMRAKVAKNIASLTDTEKTTTAAEKSSINCQKSVVSAGKSSVISDKLLATSEKLPAGAKTLPTNRANLPAKESPDLDDVSSQGSFNTDNTRPSNRLDAVSSDGEMEEGEITDDEDTIPNSRNVWPHPEQAEMSRRLRVLVVGDNRAREMVANNGVLFSSAVCYFNDAFDIHTFCTSINDRLKEDNQYDLVLLFVYHMNLVFPDKVNVAGHDIELLRVRKNISISYLFNVVKVHDKKWKKYYPDTNFIWATPYPIDFIACNEARLSSVSREWAQSLMKAELGSKPNETYWRCIKDISKSWSKDMPHVKRFPMHVPMLVRATDRSNFHCDGSGCLPPGYLTNGIRPTGLFRQQFATMLMLYLSENFPSLGLGSTTGKVPFGAIATEVSAWLAESAAAQPNLLINRGECYDDSVVAQTSLQIHRELYTLYHNKPMQHPEYVRQKQIYSWQMDGAGDDDRENGWRNYWTTFILKDFDRTWSIKNEQLMQTYAGRGRSSSRRTENGSKILISSDSENSDRKKIERKHSRSRSKSKNSDKFRHRKSKHRSKRSNRDHHKKKRKRRRRSISCSDDLSSEDEEPSCKRQNISNEEEDDDMDIDELIHKERAKIAMMKQNNTAELKKNVDDRGLSKPVSGNDSMFPLTDSNVISDDSGTSLSNSKAHNSSSCQNAAACGGLSSTRNDGSDESSFILVSSDFASEQQTNSSTVYDVRGKDDLSESSKREEIHEEVPASDEEIAEFELDLDIDEKMDELLDDPDFMKDLEKLGDDMESIIDKDQLTNDCCSQEDKENEGTVMTVSKGTPTPLSSHCEETKHAPFVEREESSMIDVLKILNNVSSHFGPLAGSISDMHRMSVECIENARDPITLLTKNNCAILEVVYSKLRRFIEDSSTSELHRAIYVIAARELRQLLDHPQPNSDMFLGVNIANIAKATLGSNTARIISFIKNTLMYHGLSEVPKDDVMRIFMAVKSVQLKMLENEDGLDQS